MQNQCVYFTASATLVECLYQTCSNLLHLWRSGRSSEEFRDIFIDCALWATELIFPFLLFHSTSLGSKSVRIICTMPSQNKHDLCYQYIHYCFKQWGNEAASSPRVPKHCFGSSSFFAHTSFTPVQPQSTPGGAPKHLQATSPHIRATLLQTV